MRPFRAFDRPALLTGLDYRFSGWTGLQIGTSLADIFTAA
jgi:hypothetical protein